MIDEQMYLFMIFGDDVTIKRWGKTQWLIEKDPEVKWDIVRAYTPKGWYVRIYRPRDWTTEDAYVVSFVEDPK